MIETVTYQGETFDAAELVAQLHNGSRARGMGLIHARGAMTRADGAAWLANDERFDLDYVHGRPIKVRAWTPGDGQELSEGSERLYDRDNGAGAFQAALARTRKASPR